MDAVKRARHKAWREKNREWVKEYNRAAYAANKEAIQARQRKWYAASPTARVKRSEYFKTRKAAAKLAAFAHYGPEGKVACCRCGIEDPDVLTLDHVNNDGSEHRKTDKQAKALCFWVAKKGFPEGFQTMCLNCNYKKHLERTRDKTGATNGNALYMLI